MDRSTRQRHTLQLVFQASDRPLNVQDLLNAGRKILPALGIATVYRTVKSLLDEKWLIMVQIPGGPAHYEPAGKSHHHHFRCRKCQRLFDLDGCVSDLKVLAPSGFQLDGHDIVLYGSCKDCSKKR